MTRARQVGAKRITTAFRTTYRIDSAQTVISWLAIGAFYTNHVLLTSTLSGRYVT